MKHSKVGKATPKTSPQERGINLDVPGSALAAQAAERIAWHQRNAALMKAQLDELETKSSTELTTADGWKRDARRSEITRLMLGHEEYARFLTFVKRHLKRRQIYRLGMTDLAVLEITPKVPYL